MCNSLLGVPVVFVNSELGDTPYDLFSIENRIGAMAAFQEAGIRVPDDIAVAGFDDISSARYANPSLTTVDVPVHDLGRRAGERLIEHIQSDQRLAAQQFQLPLDLKVRTNKKKNRLMLGPG